MFAIVYKHNGHTGTILTDAPTEQIAQRSFRHIENSAKAKGDAFEFIGNPQKFANGKEHDAWLADFRKKLGKSPEPSAEELVENAKRVLSDPKLVEADESGDE